MIILEWSYIGVGNGIFHQHAYGTYLIMGWILYETVNEYNVTYYALWVLNYEFPCWVLCYMIKYVF